MPLTFAAHPPRLVASAITAGALMFLLVQVWAGLVRMEESLVIDWWEDPALAEDSSPPAGSALQAVRAPAAYIPAEAQAIGLSGSCDVMFDIDVHGRPFNLTAQCTDNIFWGESVRAVSKAVFLPAIGPRGVAERHGAVYRIEFDPV